MIEVSIYKVSELGGRDGFSTARAYLEVGDTSVALCSAPLGREAAQMAADRLRRLALRFEQLAQYDERNIFKQDIQDEVNQWQRLRT